MAKSSFTILIFYLAFFPTLLSSLSLPNFDGNLFLTGDAKLTSGSSAATSVQLTTANATSGFILRRNPFRFAAFPRSRRSNNPNPVSFSTDFTFSISQHNGDGLALVILPAGSLPLSKLGSYGLAKESKFFAVEFDTFVNEDVGDVNGNHVGIDVNSLVSMKTSNLSSIGLVLNSGMKLKSWIDYDSSGKRLEVRVSKFGSPRPYSPLLACIIDLGEIFKGQEVFFGLSSSIRDGDGVAAGDAEIYSWRFKTRIIPKWLHSKPMDPSTFSNEKVYSMKKKAKKGCLSWILLSLICGTSVTLGVLFMWLLCAAGNDERVTVIPMNLAAAKTGEFRYAKIDVVVDDDNLKYQRG